MTKYIFAKRMVFFICLMLTVITAHGLTTEWKLITDKKGIKVYRKHTDESKIKSFKGVAAINIQDLRVLPAMLKDHENLPKWMHMISKFTLVDSDFNREESGKLFRRFYVETHLPWPVKDRDIYIDVKMIQTDDYSIFVEVKESDYQPAPAKGYVRIPEIRGEVSGRALEGEQDVVFNYEMMLDPGGYVPAWLVNLITSDIPYFSLLKLKRLLPEVDGKSPLEEEKKFARRPWMVVSK